VAIITRRTVAVGAGWAAGVAASAGEDAAVSSVGDVPQAVKINKSKTTMIRFN